MSTDVSGVATDLDDPWPPPRPPAPVRAGRSARAVVHRITGPLVQDDRDDDITPTAPLWVPGAVVAMIGALLIAFALDLLVIGQVREGRDQVTAFATLRGQLANGVAPVNQTVDGKHPLPLGVPLAILEVPQLGGGSRGLRQVVLEGTTSGVLMSGPGHRRDTPMPCQAGTSILLGRQAGFGGPFADIGDLTAGMVFFVTTGQGRCAYRILDVRYAGDPVPAPPAVGAGRLVLVSATGTPFAPTGTVRVDADLVPATDPASGSTSPFEAGPRPISALDLPASERPMRGDLSAWPAVVTWALLLVVVAGTTAWVRWRWGRWQTWLAAAPPLLAISVGTAEAVARLLPNLL